MYFNILQAGEREGLNYRKNRRHGRGKIRNGNQAARGIYPELMEQEILSDPCQGGSGQLSGCGC